MQQSITMLFSTRPDIFALKLSKKHWGFNTVTTPSRNAQHHIDIFCKFRPRTGHDSPDGE
jgi:hypothetical protein